MPDPSPAPSSRPDSRYEIGVLIGPCSEPDAVALMEQVDEFVNQRLGGITSLVRQELPDTTAREHADTVREIKGFLPPAMHDSTADPTHLVHRLDALLAEVDAANLARIAAEAAMAETLLAHKQEVERLERELGQESERLHLAVEQRESEWARAETAEALAERRGIAMQEVERAIAYAVRIGIGPTFTESAALLRVLRAALADGGQENPAP